MTMIYESDAFSQAKILIGHIFGIALLIDYNFVSYSYVD